MEKITHKKLLKSIFPLLVTNLMIISVFYYWFSDDVSIFKNTFFIMGIFSILIIPVIIQLIIFINHYKINKQTILNVNNNKVIITYNNKTFTICDNNILSWQLIGTSSKIKDSSIKFSLIDDLFYVRIYVKDINEPIILTSLLNSKIDILLQVLFPSQRLNDTSSIFPFIRPNTN